MITPLLWAALQIAAAPSMSATPWPTPTVHTIPSMGQLVLADSPNPDLTSVRVFVPLASEFRGMDESRILVGLADLRARSLADRAGVQFSASLESDGIVYSAAGSNIDVDHVFAVLSLAVRVPDDNAFAYGQAARPLLQRREVAHETGGGWIMATLSSRLCEGAQTPRVDPGLTPSAGDQPLRSRTRTLWVQSHQSPLPVVTVVSTLPEAVVFSGLDLIRSSLPQSEAAAEMDAFDPTPAPRSPSVLRVWYGTAHPLPDSAGVEALVVGELLETALAAASGESELYAEIRTTPCGAALFVWGSAFPRDGTAMRERVRGLLSGFEGSLDESIVTRAANRIRFRLLADADTPAGRAAAVAAASEGRPQLDDLVAGLRESGVEGVTAFLSTVTQATGVTAGIGR